MINKDTLFDKYGKYVAWISLAVLYILCFKVVIQSGYMFDDMWNYIERGLAINNDVKVSDLVLGDMNIWWHRGRFLVFSFYCDYAVGFVPLVVYKFMLVTAMFLDGIVIAGIIKELTESKVLSYLCVIMFPVMISFRATYYTGVYAFHGLVQLCFLFTFFSVYCYIKYRKTNKVNYQVISCISLFVALGLYEVSYVLCICFIIALICLDGWDYVKKNIWKSIKTGLPQIIVMFTWIVFNILIKLFATSSYDGITPNLNLGKIISTFLKQCSGGIGFGAAATDFIENGRSFWITFIKENVDLVQICGYLLFFIVFLCTVLYVKDKYNKKLISIVWIGISLIVLPSLLIAVSVKYQDSVEWFKGYIPAYFASWGFAILAAVFVVYVGRKIKSRKVFAVFNVVMAVLFTSVFIFDNIVGIYSAADADSFYQNDVDTMWDAIDAGLLKDIDMDYALDVSDSIYSFDVYYTNRAYATWLLRKNNIYGWDDIYKEKLKSTELNDLYNKMESEGFKVINHRNKSYAMLADCNDLQLSLDEDGYDYKVYSDSVNLFIYNDIPLIISFIDIDGEIGQININDSNIISEGRYGKVYHIEFDKNIDACTISVGE